MDGYRKTLVKILSLTVVAPSQSLAPGSSTLNTREMFYIRALQRHGKEKDIAGQIAWNGGDHSLLDDMSSAS